MKKSGFMKDAFTLFMITLISGVLLGAVYQITAEPIAIAMEKAKQEAYKKVFADAESFKENESETAAIEQANTELANKDFGKVLINEVVDAVDASGNVVGSVVTSTSKDGYGGDVKISVGITKDGTVNSIAFLTLAETPGLGMRAKEPKFNQQYNGKKVDAFVVTKTGKKQDNEIDAISGSTITSKAVTNAVNAALFFASNYVGK